MYWWSDDNEKSYSSANKKMLISRREFIIAPPPFKFTRTIVSLSRLHRVKKRIEHAYYPRILDIDNSSFAGCIAQCQSDFIHFEMQKGREIEKTIEIRRVKWNEFVSLIGHRYARTHFKPFISLFSSAVSTEKRTARLIWSYFLIGATVIVAAAEAHAK